MRQPEQEVQPEVVEQPEPEPEKVTAEVEAVEVEDKKEESDAGLDLVADECLDLSKNRSKLYKQERNDIEMQDESVMNTNSI